MNKSNSSRGVLIKVTILLLVSYLAHGQRPLFTSVHFSKLDKLVGTWRTDKKSGVFYEHWLKKSADQFEGKSYKIAGNDTLILERVRLAMEGSRIVYAVRNNGVDDGKETLFYLREIKGDDYIFEDMEHDFPQRIVYNMAPGHVLHAYIEGVMKGELKRSEYPYVRLVTKK